jgi:hypothetical protein
MCNVANKRKRKLIDSKNEKAADFQQTLFVVRLDGRGWEGGREGGSGAMRS